MVVTGAFWPAAFAFVAVTLAMLVLIDFGTYVASRYRERYLEEAKTELDDVLIQIPPGRILDLSIAASAVGGIITIIIMLLQLDSFSWQWGIPVALAVAALLFPAPRFALKYIRKKRLAKFNFQLEDALGMMSGALKAGFSINQALEEVAACDLHPVSVEFRLLLQEIRLGVPLDQALENMSGRLGSDDFDLVVTAIVTARQTGGELTGTLERVAMLIRERVRISQRVMALTAMGRLQAAMIGAMPFLLMVGLHYVSPEMMSAFTHSAVGVIAIAAVVLLVACGFIAIRKITNIEV
ncbi:MAG: type II secretion system F family protein [Lentisphaeria bacterium]|nr:type II secretion system F family protein [Lentisphaeria bacterium]